MNKLLLQPSYEWFITFIASFLIWILVFLGFYYFLVKKKIKNEVFVYTFWSCIITWLTSEIIKSLIPSLRPFKVNGYPPLTVTIPSSHSFPSSHTALAFALAIPIFLREKKLGWQFLMGALFVGLGRILANVHYFVDVLGGGLLGIIIPILIGKFFFGYPIPFLKSSKKQK